MALAAVRARVLRSLSRPPFAARRCSGPAHLPPGCYGAWQERAARDPAAFWADAARGALRWDSPFHTACEAAPAGAGARWFLGGRLNVSGKHPAAAHPYPCAAGAALAAAAAAAAVLGPVCPSAPRDVGR